MSTAPAWIGIAGPTASGKTALALAIARAMPVEIISVDSALVYRGMDIGTAKPTAEEQACAPHHLIDIIDPTEAYSAAHFVRDATALCHEIRARGRTPLLVGGTMLYFKALLEGLDDMPEAQPELRAQIETRAASVGWPALHGELARVDPDAARRLSPNDSQRIGRALEVYLATGRPLSSFHRRNAGGNLRPTPLIDGLPGVLLSLEPLERAWLHQRIAQRFDAMLAQGFIAEAQALWERGDLHLGLPSMRCVGYRQAWEALDAARAAGGISKDEIAGQVRERGIAATRQLAKRQLTWLRSMDYRLTIPCDGIGVEQQALRLVQQPA